MLKILDRPALLDFRQWLFSLGRQGNNRWLNELIKPDAEDNILDVGCGTGRYSEIFNCNYYGIDSNEEYINYARKKHRGDFQAMDASHLEFPDDMFKYVFSIGVLHHISDENAIRAIREMKRVCRPDGKILIIEAIYPTRKLNIIGYLLFRFDPGKFTRHLDELVKILSDGNSSPDFILNKGFPYESIICNLTPEKIYPFE
ncbi:MAG: class I SAM-dependent methyltransferase [Dehalococcoidales bacterium]|nr:class I SAM-dependent methyltransferase [Dehalococcoidales bacterium]